jgi:MaoC like domain
MWTRNVRVPSRHAAIPIAHGFLTLSLLSRLSRDAIEIRGDFQMRINYGFNRVRFVSPVPSGSRIRARFTVQKVTENEVTWLVTVEIEGAEKPALGSRPASGYPGGRAESTAPVYVLRNADAFIHEPLFLVGIQGEADRI